MAVDTISNEKVAEWPYVPTTKRDELLSRFPHGPNALLLDEAWLKGDRAYGLWKYRADTPYFQDHFPRSSGLPTICPGNVILEVADLVAACLRYLNPEYSAPYPMIQLVKAEMEIRGNIRDGEEMLVIAEQTRYRMGVFEAETKAFSAPLYREYEVLKHYGVEEKAQEPKPFFSATLKGVIVPAD